jgi:choline dehydrogenase-like flavoprotein
MDGQTYDFIVVGGGTSGLVTATRLTESPDVSVLVLEAGASHLQDPRVLIPGLCLSLQGSEADWKLASIPQVWLKRKSSGQRQC